MGVGCVGVNEEGTAIPVREKGRPPGNVCKGLPLELEEMCLRWEVTRLQWERWPGRRVGPVSGSDDVEGVGSLLRWEPG